MHRYVLAIFALSLVLSSSVRAQPQPPRARSAFKHRTVDQAWQAAQESKRPLLLFIHSENCRFCVKMEQETYSNPQIAAALVAAAETVSVRKEDHAQLVQKLKIRAYPTTVVVAPDGKEIGRVEGFLNPQKFAAKMFSPPSQRHAQQRPAAKPIAQR